MIWIGNNIRSHITNISFISTEVTKIQNFIRFQNLGILASLYVLSQEY